MSSQSSWASRGLAAIALWAAVLVFGAGCGTTEPPADQCTVDRKAKCAEGNTPCRTFECVSATGACKSTDEADKAVCDDGDKCTENEACAAGVCAGGTAVKADDKNPCTDDSCVAKTGVAHDNNTAACDDDDACTEKDKCKDGKCVAGAKKDCADGNPCTEDDSCNGGKCGNKPMDAACSDNDKCTKDDKCVADKCEGGDKVVTDDKNSCTKDACDPKGGVTNEVVAGGACDDGDKCTEADKCDAGGKCQAGTAVKKDDGNPCTKDSCVAATGVVNEPVADAACDDGNACTDGDKCDAAGNCKAGAATKVDDGNPCTTDSCDKVKGVGHEANTDACEDGSACTEGDKCADKVCKGGGQKPCDDTKVCTTDACDPKVGCTFAPNTGACDDGDKCTDGDACSNGVCVPGAAKNAKACDDGNPCTIDLCDVKIGCTTKPTAKVACDDGNACTEGDVCDAGACSPGVTKACNDENACTDDTCDPKSGCKFSPNAKACDDSNACTTGDVCKAGACAPGAASGCDDKNPCTVDQCDKATGKCGTQAVTDGTACEDSSLCTNDTVCKIGQCAGGTKVVCKDDGNPCTSDACLDATGCKYPAQDGPCDADGSVCTPKDTCSGGKCVADSIKSCDDGNPCTDDVCDKLKDCVNTPNSKPCDDKLMCTEGDTCKDGSCKVNTPKNCSDGNTCTEDQCDPAKGCLNPKSLDISACDDGDACSTGDACAGGLCKSSGPGLWLGKDGTSLEDELYALAPASDGGFVAAGYRNVAPGLGKGLIRKVDATGKLVFDVLVPPGSDPGSPTTVLNDIVTVPGGGYVAVGTGANLSFHAIKVTTNGAVVWEKGYSGIVVGIFRDAVALPAGKSAAVAAVGYDPGGGARVTEIDPNGGEINTFLLKSPNGGTTLDGRAIAWSPSGDYWVACQYGTPSGQFVARIVRLQYGTGNIIKAFDIDAQNKAESRLDRILADANGMVGVGLQAGGPNGGKDGWIVRIDNSYAKVGEQFVGDTEQDYLWDLMSTGDGGFLTVGGVFAGLKSMHGILARFDKNLAPVWQRLYYGTAPGVAGTAAGGSTYLRGVAGTANGQIAFAGQTAVASKGTTDLFYGICDLYGNCDCASSGTCLTKASATVDDKNPCTLDWCEAGAEKHAIGNEGLTCGTAQTCVKGKCQ